jgi:hypothetical protein
VYHYKKEEVYNSDSLEVVIIHAEQSRNMSYSSRPLASHLRQGSTTSSSGPSPVLLARINEKKAELENLKQLRDLSAGLAGQMQMLEEKLGTLSDGTEGLQTYNFFLHVLT